MTTKFNNVYVGDSYTIAGVYEKDGPISDYFDSMIMTEEPFITLDKDVCWKWPEKHYLHFLLHPPHTIRWKQFITMYVVFKETIIDSLMLTSPYIHICDMRNAWTILSMFDLTMLLIFEIKWNMGWIENEVFSLS